MNDYRDAFEQQLIEASQRLEQQSTRPRFAWSRRSVALVAIATVGTGSAIAATKPWSPILGDPDLPGPRPTATGTPPPAEQLQTLGVMRRDADSKDRGPETAASLRYMSGTSTFGVRTAYIRHLADAQNGGAVTLIPMRAWRPAPGEKALREPVCVVYPDTAGAAKSCWTTDDVTHGRAFGSLGALLYGLVPDGVSEVIATYASGQSATGPVTNNFFSFGAPQDPLDPGVPSANPTRIQGLDKDGHAMLDFAT